MKKTFVYSPALGKHIEAEVLDIGAHHKVRRRPDDSFVGCPVSWLTRVLPVVKSSKQLAVAIWLWRRRVVCGNGDTFSAPNGELEGWKISRQVKYQTLKLLSAAGVITTECKGKKAPQVTILAPKRRGKGR